MKEREASRYPPVEGAAFLFHILALKHRIQCWLELVPSDKNRSDGVSRVGFDGVFAREEGFALRRVQVPCDWWSRPPGDIYSEGMKLNGMVLLYIGIFFFAVLE